MLTCTACLLPCLCVLCVSCVSVSVCATYPLPRCLALVGYVSVLVCVLYALIASYSSLCPTPSSFLLLPPHAPQLLLPTPPPCRVYHVR